MEQLTSADSETSPVLSDELDASVAKIAGIGPKRLAALHRRGIDTFGDALMHLPQRYQDLRQRDRIADLRVGATAVVEGTLGDLKTRPMRGMGWRRLTTATLKDEAGAGIRVAWFNLHGGGQMPTGEPLLLYGRVTVGADGSLEMLHPEIWRLRDGAPAPLRPSYSLPAEIPQRLFSVIVAQALTRAAANDRASIPPELASTTGLPRFTEALAMLHQPAADTDFAALEDATTPAHQALALDEMFVFQLAMGRERARNARRSGAAIDGSARLSQALIDGLSFTPTKAQFRAIAEISADLATPSQMNRILIGDVGSGKTLVAFHAMLRAIEAGWQAVMMAPTELLAEQHFANFTRLAGPLGVNATLLTGQMPAAERARMRRALHRGDLPIAFGTHALFQEKLRMERLGLAIIDEQHRFGVFDRARLIARGSQANVLLMTATPIPRSLALTLLKHLEVSHLDEMPPGRTPVTTEIFTEDQIAGVDRIAMAELAKGNRIYYVLPLIAGENEESVSVATAARRLRGPLGKFGIGTLHGRMRAGEKDRVMRDFRDGVIGVLVATTVVEVGVDVPEATVMVIVGAERYGLAQLHQLRGRVGRGAGASRCCLIVSRNAPAASRARLDALAQTSRGEEVAALDLKLRGPGDLFGARQTGALPLRFGGFIRDIKLIERAGKLADEWLTRDPGLQTPSSAAAINGIKRMLALGFSLGDIG